MSMVQKCQKCSRVLPSSAFEIVNGKAKSWCYRCRDRQSKRATKYAPNIFAKFCGLNYKSRNKTLRSMGFKTYQEYLDSKLWRQIRSIVYATKGSKCVICFGEASQLHHNRYHRNDLSGKTLTHIHPLCRGCHLKIEFENGRKNSLAEAKHKFERQLPCLETAGSGEAIA